jgi:hypothetical protein
VLLWFLLREEIPIIKKKNDDHGSSNVPWGLNSLLQHFIVSRDCTSYRFEPILNSYLLITYCFGSLSSFSHLYCNVPQRLVHGYLVSLSKFSRSTATNFRVFLT